MNLWWITIPLIGALIGWITNKVAIKMLFHPVKARRILGFTVQGVFPKRQQQFAEKSGKLVSNELLSFNEIQQKIINPANLDKVLPLLDTHIDIFLKERLKHEMPMVAAFLGEKTIAQFKAVFLKELQPLFPVLMQNYMNNLQEDLDLEKIVITKIKNFSPQKLEKILYEVMGNELKLVQFIGAALGFVIGLVQVFITIATC